MLRIKPLRLAGGYRVACATAPERERPRTGLSLLQTLSPRHRSYAVESWARAARRLRRRPNSRPTAPSATPVNPSQGRFAPSVRTLVWGKSAAPIQHNAGLCKVRSVANQVGLVPAPLRPAAFAPFGFAQPALCLAPQPSYRNVRFAHVAQQPDQRTRAGAPVRSSSQALRAGWSVVPPPTQRVCLRRLATALLVPASAATLPVRPQGGSPKIQAQSTCAVMVTVTPDAVGLR